MELKKEQLETKAIKITVEEDGKTVGRASLFLITNDLHDEPYGLLEDVFVDEAYRSKGFGRQLVKAVIQEAKDQGCRKLIGQSRYGREKVHALYLDLGFNDHGKNFRMDFIK